VLPGVAADEAASAVQAFLAAAHAEVERLTGNGVRRLDTRAGVVSLEVDRRAMADEQSGCAILRMVVRHLTPAVRPDDILTALRRVAGLAPSVPPLVTRLAQGPLEAVTAAAGPAGHEAPAGPSGSCASRAAVPQPLGPGAAQDHVETTRPGAPSAGPADAVQVSAYDQLSRGAAGSSGTHAPGSLTGDSPDARNRAQRRTAQRHAAPQ